MFASCMALSDDSKSVYVGYKSCGTIERYSILKGIRDASILVHSGDVLTLRELWPDIVCSSGSNNTVCLFEVNMAKSSGAASLRHSVVKHSADEAMYNELSSGMMHVHSIECPSDSVSSRLIICPSVSSMPYLVNLRDSFTIRPLAPADNIGK